MSKLVNFLLIQYQENLKFKITPTFLFIFFNILVLLTNSAGLFSQRNYVVVLDAGHGGKDSGANSNGYIEKDIVLKVAKITGKALSKEEDINVVYTRHDDVFIDLWRRGEIANNAKADLFVSIHCDASRYNKKAYGASTFVLGLKGNKKNLEIAKRENAVILLEDRYSEKYSGFDPNSVETVIGLSLLQEENLDKSLAIAVLIQNNFVKKLSRNDRKVRQANFQVLRETIMPSVLVELGFLTNKKESRYLNSSRGQKQLGNALAKAILSYIDNLKINTINKKKFKNNGNIEYRIQIASGKRKISTRANYFKGLKGVVRVKINYLYKYYYRNTSDYNEAKKHLEEVKSKGFNSAFIVAFANGKKIPVQEAVKIQYN